MKKHIVLPVITIFLLLMSCKSDSYDIEEKSDIPEKEFLFMEAQIKSENVEIKSVNALIKGQEKKLGVVSYDQLDGNSGYKIVMSDGSDIILKPESKSLVGVKRFSDGSFYWTFSGEFMLDANSKMIIVNGVAPILRLNKNNEWQISYNSSRIWQNLFDESGNTIIASDENTKDEDSTGLKIEETDNSIVIIYKEVTYSVRKFVRPKLPIEYLTEHNVNITGDGFCENHNSNVSGLFNWYETTGTTNLDYNITNRNILNNAVFENYHLGTHNEWRGVLPDEIIHWEGGNHLNVDESIAVAGETTNYKADYNVKNSSKVCYALRFKDNDNSMLSAYRYEYVNLSYIEETLPSSSNKLSCEYFNKMLRVKVLYLGKYKANTTLEDISNDVFWSNSEESYITRIFPASGYSAYNKNGEISRDGEQGFYWTDTDNGFFNGVGYAVSMNFYQRYVSLAKNAYNEKRDKYAIRLFSNK